MSTNTNYQKTPQEPILSGFGRETTAEEVLEGIDLRGKTAIVTGGYSGIGLETTRALANKGATVIVPARNKEKAKTSLSAIQNIELEELDLMDPSSIDIFTKRFLETGRDLDILINNAGIMTPPLTRDSRGYESQFATNHLGHFQLTVQLWPALKQAASSRVVSVSSAGHMYSGVDFDDPNFEQRDYNKGVAYAQSKSANSLFAVALDKLGHEDGIRAFAVHPGEIKTNLFKHFSDEDINALAHVDFKTEEQGAATSVWCATSPLLNGKGGVYCLNADIARAVPTMEEMPDAVLHHAIDPSQAERLWELSETLTGIKLNVS